MKLVSYIGPTLHMHASP